MRFSYFLTKATNRQSEHVRIFFFPRQQYLRERASTSRYMHIGCLVTYRERNGNWFYVCVFYMNCTALRHTGHSNEYISCTETVTAQSLQLLGYVLCNRGPRVWFRLWRDFSTQCADRFCGPLWPPPFWYWGFYPWGKVAGTWRLFLHHLVPRCKMYGATPPLPHVPSWRGS